MPYKCSHDGDGEQHLTEPCRGPTTGKHARFIGEWIDPKGIGNYCDWYTKDKRAVLRDFYGSSNSYEKKRPFAYLCESSDNMPSSSPINARRKAVPEIERLIKNTRTFQALTEHGALFDMQRLPRQIKLSGGDVWSAYNKAPKRDY